MCQRVIANTPKFLLFDFHSAEETKHLLYCSDYVLVWPQKIGWTLYLGASCHRLLPSQLVLLSPFSPHRFEFKLEGENAAEAKCNVLHFRLNALGQTFIDSVQFFDIKNMLESARGGSLFDICSDSSVNNYLSKIENNYEIFQLINLLSLLDYLSKMNNCCLTESHFNVADCQRKENKVRVALTYIAENFTQPLTATMVAKQLHMADSTFSRFFHANLGVTFRQYLIEQRIRQAARYLVTTDWNIAQIGAEVGFSSLSNFNAKFKNMLRVTPREYRASYLNKQHYLANYRSVVGQLQKQLV